MKPIIDIPGQPDVPAPVLTEVAIPNRAVRRRIGLRLPESVFIFPMRAAAQTFKYPRAVRRLFRDPALAEARVKRYRARVNRALRPQGVSI